MCEHKGIELFSVCYLLCKPSSVEDGDLALAFSEVRAALMPVEMAGAVC